MNISGMNVATELGKTCLRKLNLDEIGLGENLFDIAAESGHMKNAWRWYQSLKNEARRDVRRHIEAFVAPADLHILR